MLTPIQYFVLLALVTGYAFIAGRAAERFAASVCVIASVASIFVVAPLLRRFDGVEMGVLAIDLLTLLAFTWLALRSDRFWPLWIAGLQLTTLVAHGLKAIQLDLLPQAYAAAARFWVYPIFLIIIVGTWRSRERRLQERGMRAA